MIFSRLASPSRTGCVAGCKYSGCCYNSDRGGTEAPGALRRGPRGPRQGRTGLPGPRFSTAPPGWEVGRRCPLPDPGLPSGGETTRLERCARLPHTRRPFRTTETSSSGLPEGQDSVYVTKAQARTPDRTGSSSRFKENQAVFALLFKARNVYRVFVVITCFSPFKRKAR